MPDSILPVVRPCTKCGTAERYPDGSCKACKKSKRDAYRAKNPDKVKAIRSAWYAANRVDKIAPAQSAYRAANKDKVSAAKKAWGAKNHARIKEARAAYRVANLEKVTASIKAWKASNPDARRAYQQNRRARKNKSGGALSVDIVEKLLKLQKGKCPCCSLPLGDDFHLDHKMPLALGGDHVDDNMQLLKARCNMQKRASHPIDFMQSRGFLL